MRIYDYCNLIYDVFLCMGFMNLLFVWFVKNHTKNNIICLFPSYLIFYL